MHMFWSARALQVGSLMTIMSSSNRSSELILPAASFAIAPICITQRVRSAFSGWSHPESTCNWQASCMWTPTRVCSSIAFYASSSPTLPLRLPSLPRQPTPACRVLLRQVSFQSARCTSTCAHAHTHSIHFAIRIRDKTQSE